MGRPGDEPIRPGEFDDELVSHLDCQSLWAAKIRLMMLDAIKPPATLYAYDAERAIRWFRSDEFVCTAESAGLDAERIRAEVDRRISLGQEGRLKEANMGLSTKARGRKYG